MEGYKETKIGILPKDWGVVKQVEVATFFNGRAYKLSEWETEGIPVIRLQNLTGSGKEYYYSNLQLPEHQYCCRGDLLYMWSATFGPVWWFGEKAIFHYHIWKIEHNQEKLDRAFHYYLLDDVTRRMKNESHGSTMMHVTKGGMEKLLIQLPPLPEQQKIADILSTVDAKIEVIDQQITETQDLKKGLMQRLLIKGIGHTEFKDSALGEIPVDWEVVSTDIIGEITSSKRVHKADYTNKGIPFFRGKEITQLAKGKKLNSTVYIKESKFQEFREKYGAPEAGDVLITAVGTIGSIYLVKENDEFYFKDGNLMWIRKITNKLDKSFLMHYFRSNIFQNSIDIVSSGSSQKALTIVKFKRLFVPIPNIVEQQKIAEILTSIYEKLEVLSEKKATYQELKKGLMQQLLTGKVRVTV